MIVEAKKHKSGKRVLIPLDKIEYVREDGGARNAQCHIEMTNGHTIHAATPIAIFYRRMRNAFELKLYLSERVRADVDHAETAEELDRLGERYAQ